MNDNVQD